MPLYVRDEGVNRLAGEAQKILGTPTKTDAVRFALERLLAEQESEVPIRERLKAIQRRARELGTSDPNFDEKAFMDEMWGHED